MKIIFLFFLIELCFLWAPSSFLLGISTQKKTPWTLFIYIDSSDGLSDAIINNISDIALAQCNQDNISIIIQLHSYDSYAYRYHIKGKFLVLLDKVMLGDNYQQNFIDAAQWAFKNYPSDKQMLLFSSHGYGILDPTFDEVTQTWQFEADVPGINNHLDEDEVDMIFSSSPSSCALRTPLIYDHFHNHRGYVFNYEPRVYLTSQGLVDALEIVCKDLGKQIDIIGFDTCMGGMFENLYQFKKYANILIGVQSCAEKDGFNYSALGDIFCASNKNSEDIASAFVRAFDECYRAKKSTKFTLTAAHMTSLDCVVNLLDKTIQSINECIHFYGEKIMRRLFYKAREMSYKSCLFSMYVDMYSLLEKYSQVLAELNESNCLHELQGLLSQTCQALSRCIIAHCAAPQIKDKLHGLAVYCPLFHIDSSYEKTNFGIQVKWSNFLKFAVGDTKEVIN